MKYLIAACLIVAAMPSAAAIPVEQAVELCRAEQNALRRLTCYDAITIGTAADTQVAKPMATSPTKPVTKPEQSKKDFGLEHKKNDEDITDVLYMTVKDVRYSPHKDLIVEFDNGQVWRQYEAGYYKINVGEKHFIKRGMLNSFFLGNDSNNRTVRVRREQ